MQHLATKPESRPLPPATQGASTRAREFPASHETLLRGWQLGVARTVVLVTMITINGLHLLALPGLVEHLATPCADVVDLTGPERCLLTPDMVAPLMHLGLTPVSVAWAVVALSYLTLLLVDAVAAVVILRHSNDWMALLVALTLILLPLPFTPVLHWLGGGWEALIQVFGSTGWALFLLVLGLFPSGRFVPRWLGAPVCVALLLTPAAVPALSGGAHLSATMMNTVFLLWELVSIGTMLGLLAGQRYRYRRVSTPVQQQQTKWAVFGLVLSLVVLLLFMVPFLWTPAERRPGALFIILRYPDGALTVGILAVTFGIAILRNRLYDIDFLINRSLVYGALTAILGLLYIGGVISLQAVANGLAHAPGGEGSPLVIVVTTLGIVVLVRPIRGRLQTLVDRRFYRRKYDAAKTLETFSTTLRAQMDLDELQKQLLTVVAETMLPAHASLWLRQSERKTRPS